MPITLGNYREYCLPQMFNGVEVPFFIFTGEPLPEARAKLLALQSAFSRMPEQHLRAVYPFIIIPGRLPSRGHGGGTPDLPASAVRGHERDLGTSPEVVLRLMEDYRGTRSRAGFHWIPGHVWSDLDRYPATILHEAIHGIDINLGLATRRRVAPADASRLDIPGSVVRPYAPADFILDPLPGAACGSGPVGVRAAVNAYFKLLGGFSGITSDVVQRRIARELSMSRAFESVPTSWWEATCPALVPSAAGS